MKIATRSALFATVVFFVSCDRQEAVPQNGKTTLVQPASNGSWKESDFTPWMSRAALQIRQEKNPGDQYFARVEGRDNGGLMEYRAALKPFDPDKYEKWAVFWGIDDKELFEWELKLMKSGFFRDNMQIFSDASGQVYHQIVWLKQATHTIEPEKPAASASGPGLSEPSPRPQEPVAAEREPQPIRVVPNIPAPPPPVVIPETEPAPAPEPVAPPTPPPAKPVEEMAPVAPEPTPKTEEVKPTKQVTYSVRAGDTLGKIAKSKGVSVADLKAANNMKNDIVRIGQKLVIPVK